MRQLTHRLALAVVGISTVLLLGAGPAIAQTQTCQFDISAPAPITTTITLTAQGVYCLMTDVSTDSSFTSGNAIEIANNNIVLDLNGHKVGGQAAGPFTNAIGVHAFQRRNITIKNGTVRGFQWGILLEDVSPFTTSSGHRVEGVLADQNWRVGIHVEGIGNLVRGNRVPAVVGTGLTIITFGIVAAGPGARFVDNDVIQTLCPTGAANCTSIGMQLSDAPGSVVEQNRVGNQTVETGSKGIWVVGSSADVLVVANRILGYATGVQDDSSGGKCRDNFFAADVTVKVAGCTDVANNN